MAQEKEVDVFICGAGPVGLLLAYQLTRLGISVHIIDAADKTSPDFPMVGRACHYLPRSLEFMDLFDLYDDLAQVGVASRTSFVYLDGQRVPGNGWYGRDHVVDTFFDFYLNLSLKYSEDIFRQKLEELGGFVEAPWKLTGVTIDEDPSVVHKVSARCQRVDGEATTVRAKYIVGADGGGSTVRKLAQIPFPGLHHADHWVRIDGVFKSDIPEGRLGIGTIESHTHGRVLWAALDHGRTRIGYALGKEIFDKYGAHMTPEQAVHEARLACAPFKVEFESVEWFTVYGIQQHVAARLFDSDCVILAGDAAHTHSSGVAQGMNTGIHDVVSLYWRLAGVLKGFYNKDVLQNYSDERHAVAHQLIENDKILSKLIAGSKPESMKDRSEETDFLFNEFQKKIGGFNVGLGISYPQNLLNDTENALATAKIQPGHRAQDAMLRLSGLHQTPVRLFELIRFNGRFRVLVFAGNPAFTLLSLSSLRDQVDRHGKSYAHAIDFLTIVQGTGIAFDETLGIRRFGKAYWDTDSVTHDRYGVDFHTGALVVVRPDGIVGHSAPLDAFEKTLVPYFDRIIIPSVPTKKVFRSPGSLGIGELLINDENNLMQSRTNAQIPQFRNE